MKDLEPNTVIVLIKLFTDTLTDLYGKDISDLIMSAINKKVRIIQHEQMMDKVSKPKENLI